MNRAEYEEAKKVQGDISQLLKKGNISSDEQQHLQSVQAQLSGLLLSVWLPFGWGQRMAMFALLLIGLYGLSEGSYYLLLAWVGMAIFSPRLVGEISFFLGRISR